MRKAHGFCHTPRIMNIATRTARAFFGQCGTVIVKLQGDANDVIAFVGQLGGYDRTVNTTRHGYDDPRLSRWFGKAK